MKKTVIATMMVTSLIAPIAVRAQGAMAVVDMKAILQDAKEFKSEIDDLDSQAKSLKDTYSMFTNASNIQSLLPDLNGSALTQPMPQANELVGSILGQTGLTPSGQQFFSANSATLPTGNDTMSQLLRQRAISISNMQGFATTQIASIDERLNDLHEMQLAVDQATDIKQLEAVHARINIENQAIQTQAAQAQSLQAMAAAQAQAQELAGEAKAHSDAQAAAAAMPAEIQ
ncbi:hypothetical protein FHR90_003092 [Endobacter medicaginis]|uniref:Uncharacterized protein n=1 Tax=Endobacter medicaginis TaxID=1181271 RepID=A0A850NJ84_9PROT|nr:type IV secretion system protein [Endobacter medicaginis]MBB3175238.1 hypothetical protein [Endobacter medicaginis]MCX5476278.1 hypothetical protein [Endobacter medicaginis]NVN28964.1 hypothetical protein [Endobacter medicaginis]